jgi:hypothetical protein
MKQKRPTPSQMPLFLTSSATQKVQIQDRLKLPQIAANFKALPKEKFGGLHPTQAN